ncbi:MAG TPA: extracellular solute-binding protein [Aestuariivirgaceae bacterium]|jgi:spermidine/putrescine transport system substrate-binding protein|nr:extracellular solute-binding protein [Aestuariivirgaceae bacterium]
MKLDRHISRRGVVKGSAAAGAVALFAPAYVKNALSSSGELNVMFWSDELPEDLLKSFTDKTGIKVNFTGFGSNEELLNKMKSTKGEGFDLISPTLNRVPQWKELGVTQAWDLKKIPVDRLNPAMLKAGEIWNLDGKGQHWLPHVWGTEGISWRTDKWQPKGEFPSYGDIWDDANAGKTMGRSHSLILGAGLWMEGEGKLEPGSMLKAAYESEAKMRPIWEKVTQFCIDKKKNIKVLWNDADTQKNGLLNEGIVCAQTWDGPPIALKNDGQPVMYRAPKEGAMAWVDGMSLPTGAKNIEQAYAFVDFDYQPEAAGKAIDKHGYNSPVIGADKFASDRYAKNFADAYPGDALSKLNPWPSEPQWYADLRAQYVNKFQSAS